MNNLALAADGAWKVLVASLILGAGLPVDLRARRPRPGLRAPAARPDGEHAERHPIGNVLFALCILVVLLGVALGHHHRRGLGLRQGRLVRAHLPDHRQQVRTVPWH